MNVEAIPRFVQGAPFRRVVWGAPMAYAVHIGEEFWQFPAWASTYFAPNFTLQLFVLGNAIGMLVLVGLTALVSAVRVRTVDFVFFSLLSGQLFHDVLFHMGATAYFGVYSPGLLSAILLYLPICYYIARAAHREGLIGNAAGVAALVVGAVGLFSVVYFGTLGHAQL